MGDLGGAGILLVSVLCSCIWDMVCGTGPVQDPEEEPALLEEEEAPLPSQLVPSSSSSPGEVMVGPAPSVPPDFRAHQELLKKVSFNLGLEAEKLSEPADGLFDLLAAAALAKIALPVHEGVLKVVKALWQTPSSLLPKG